MPAAVWASRCCLRARIPRIEWSFPMSAQVLRDAVPASPALSSSARSPSSEQPYPRLHEVERVAARLAGQVLQTPVWRWQTGVIARRFGPRTEVWLKLELFQHTGSFKL